MNYVGFEPNVLRLLIHNANKHFETLKHAHEQENGTYKQLNNLKKQCKSVENLNADKICCKQCNEKRNFNNTHL